MPNLIVPEFWLDYWLLQIYSVGKCNDMKMGHFALTISVIISDIEFNFM